MRRSHQLLSVIVLVLMAALASRAGEEGALAAGTLTPNDGTWREGANAAVWQGQGSATSPVSEVVAAGAAGSGLSVQAVWLLAGGIWRFYLPTYPDLGTLNQVPAVASLYVVLQAGPAGTTAPAPMANILLTSDAITEGDNISAIYTCVGANISLPLSWTGAPANSGAFVIIMDDLYSGSLFSHWVVYDIPATVTRLEANLPKTGTLPNSALQGRNDLGNIGYDGPCPPVGQVHQYRVRLYALNGPLGLPPGKTKAEIEQALLGRVVIQTQITVLFGR